MHFFNPPPLMALLEVVAGVESSEAALAVARAAGEAMGKRVIDAVDGPGFIVNRCNRPFGLEALRLLTERVATVEEIDRICRLGGGFRMGPFELMDLVGVDVGLEISQVVLRAELRRAALAPVADHRRGRSPRAILGRKAGRGYYEYPEGGRHRPDDPEPLPRGRRRRPDRDRRRHRSSRWSWRRPPSTGGLGRRRPDRGRRRDAVSDPRSDRRRGARGAAAGRAAGDLLPRRLAGRARSGRLARSASMRCPRWRRHRWWS